MFHPDNLTLPNWRFTVCFEIRIVLVYGLGYTHTHSHTHTPTSPAHSRYYHLRLVMVLLVGYELKNVFLSTFKHAVSQLRTMHRTHKEKSGNESRYTNPCF
jgi:hypothetical protein